MVMSSQFHISTNLHPRKNSDSWEGPTASLDTAENRKILSLLRTETQFLFIKKINPSSWVPLASTHIDKVWCTFSGKEQNYFFFYFLTPNCESSYPRNGFFLASQSIDCSFIQSINQSQSRVMMASGEKLCSNLKIYLSQFFLGSYYLYVKLNTLGITHINHF